MLARSLTVIFILSLPVAASVWAAEPADSLARGSLREVLLRMDPFEMDEVLWLAKCIYSESDRPDEQRLVAWVVRNRVETAYRGTTYREVVLEERQFSAFNTPSPRRDHILSFNQNSESRAWQRALQIALEVYRADPSERPFSLTTRHFYSPISMKGASVPDWAESGDPLNSIALGIDPSRFRFYDGVDLDYIPAKPTQPTYTGLRKTEKMSRVRTLTARSPRSLSGTIQRPVRPTIQRPTADR